MNTLYFKYALEVAKAGSITQAANNLFISQPNLSKSIRELESTLEITIFARTSKGVVPTQKGEIFLKYAKSIIKSIDDMKSTCMACGTQRQVFSISIPHASYIAGAVTSFIGALSPCGDIEISVKEEDSAKVIGSVADGVCGLGIIRCKKEYEKYFLELCRRKGLKSDLIWKYTCLAVMSREHPLANAEKINAGDFSGYTEIVCGDERIPFTFLPDSSKEGVCGKKIIYTYDRCNSLDILSTVPNTYILSSPLPPKLLELYGLVQRRCGELVEYKDILVYPKGYNFSELDKKFMDKLYQYKNMVAMKEYY